MPARCKLRSGWFVRNELDLRFRDAPHCLLVHLFGLVFSCVRTRTVRDAYRGVVLFDSCLSHSSRRTKSLLNMSIGKCIARVSFNGRPRWLQVLKLFIFNIRLNIAATSFLRCLHTRPSTILPRPCAILDVLEWPKARQWRPKMYVACILVHCVLAFAISLSAPLLTPVTRWRI